MYHATASACLPPQPPSAGSALAMSGATLTDGVRSGDGQVTISDPSTGGCPVIAAFTG